MKLWVDDHRPAPRGWRCVRSVAAAKVYLEQGLVTDISLDHDMGACAACTAAGQHIGGMTRRSNTFYDYCPHVPSGYDLCTWMAQTGRWPRASVRVHSANPAGARRMLAVIELAHRNAGSTPSAVTTSRRGSCGAATRASDQWTGAVRRAWAHVWAALTGRHTSAKS